MKKIVKLTESDLNRIVKRTLNEMEDQAAYGSENIKKLYDKLKDDEYVDLQDDSGELSGRIVSKMEYVKRMLKKSVKDKNWGKVNDVILFIDTMVK